MVKNKIRYKSEFLLHFEFNREKVNGKLEYGYSLPNTKIFLVADTLRLGYLQYLRRKKEIDKLIKQR